MSFKGQLFSPTGALRKICSLRWWLLLIYLLRATAVGQLAPSNTDTRQISPEIIQDEYALGYNSKQMEDYVADSHLAMEYYDETLDQQTLNRDIIPDNHGRSLETHQVSNKNENRAINNGFKVENRLEHDSSKTYLHLLGEQQYKQNKGPIVLKRPLKKEDKKIHFYTEPYSSVQNRGIMFQGLGGHRYSNEIIRQLIRTGRDNVGLENKNQLNNAFLTKFTTYNITKLRDNKHNESFLFEKKDNSSTDIRYLDSKNISTNYSDIHSSSLKTILQPQTLVYKNNLHSETPTQRKKLQGDTENNQRKGDINRMIPIPTIPPESNSLIDNKLTKNVDDNSINKKHYIKGQSDTTTMEEGINNNAVDFVAGQYVLRHHKHNTPSLGYTQATFDQNYKSESGVVDGQFIGEKSDNLGVRHDFVGGQFIDLQSSKDNKFGISQTIISTDNPVSDFVAGQFIKQHKNEKQTPKYVEINKNPMVYDGTQNLDENKSNNEGETEKDDSEYNDMNGRFLHEHITTIDIESTDQINQTTVMPEVTSDLDLESVGLATYGNPYVRDSEDTAEFDNEFNKYSRPTQYTDSLLSDKLKALNLYHEETTSYYDHTKLLASATPEEGYTTITSLIKEKEDKITTKILPDKKQTNSDKKNSSMVEENNEGLFDSISILGVKPIHEGKIDTSILNTDKENNNYVTDIIKKKIIKPVFKPYIRTQNPYRGMSSNSKIQLRPISILPIGKKIYIHGLPHNGNEWQRPLTVIPNNQNNVVFKTNDGDTDVIVSVSSSPSYDILQHKLPISSKNSTDVIHTAKTKIPVFNTNIKAPNSEYDEYEQDDGLLGNSNSNKSHSILELDPNSSQFLTELVANYFKTEFVTEPNNLPSEGRGRASSTPPAESYVTIDNIVGDSSDMISRSATSPSWSTINENVLYGNTYDEPNLSDQNLTDTSKTSEDVQLYAGNPLNIILNNNGRPLTDIHNSDHFDSAKKEPKNDSKTTKGHLAELCIPLKNEKYVSILDLLSGPFYFDRNGQKIAFTLRGDQKKNCTLSSKQCKLFVDLKNISSTLNPGNSLQSIKEDQHFIQKTKHEKRHISKELTLEPQKSPPNRKELSSENYKTEQFEQNIEEKSNLGMQLTGTLNSSFFKPNLRIVSDSGLLPTIHEGNQNRNQELRHSLHAIPTKFNLHTSTPSENVYDLLNYNLESIHHDQFDLENKSNKEFTDPDTHKSRPARMIDLGRSNEGDKCGCGENQILKSPSPFPNYKEFVAKRHDILKNIVHTVGDWAAGS